MVRLSLILILMERAIIEKLVLIHGALLAENHYFYVR